jgi:hypothetical protein
MFAQHAAVPDRPHHQHHNHAEQCEGVVADLAIVGY